VDAADPVKAAGAEVRKGRAAAVADPVKAAGVADRKARAAGAAAPSGRASPKSDSAASCKKTS
jgi:hypothetical protein